MPENTGDFPGYLLWRGPADLAVERIYRACVEGAGGKGELRPILDPYNEPAAAGMSGFRRRRRTCMRRGPTGARSIALSWIQTGRRPAPRPWKRWHEVFRYVRNEKLGFEVPYVDGAEEHHYRPDFIAVVDDGHGADDPLNLVLEVKGQRKPGDDAKHDTMLRLWVPAINAIGRFGRWGFLRVDGPYGVAEEIRRRVLTS